MGRVRIELQGISKSYYSETAVTQALRKINLTFYESEFVAITGESGSGKSTLLNIIGGMDTFDEGEMFVDGGPTFQYDDEDWEDYRRTKIGYVFQDYSLIGHYTVLENVVSALLVMGTEEEEAKKTAAVYLKQVGLDEYAAHRATELSSGQKQRLSIARALAKNTGIIVADEPTGNLDSETGQQIIRLLSELSKDRLVIMVTHNYDQAEAYVTRKIRVHDGQIISDVAVNEGQEGDIATEDSETGKIEIENSKSAKAGSSAPVMDRKWENKIASIFAKKNRKQQKGRAVLFTSFLFVIAVASFLFIGELFQHWDDYPTRNYSKSAYQREDQKRIVVKRKDGKVLTEEDRDRIASMMYVEAVDLYDVANDINFYLEEGQDYKYMYGDSSRSRRARERNAAERAKEYEKENKSKDKSDSENFEQDNSNQSQTSSGDEMKKVTFVNEERFMMSSDCLTEADLSAGRLPVSQDEIVLYSGEDSVLDKEKLCYFMAKNIWDANQYCMMNVKVVGLLKESTSQVYFSPVLCRNLSSHIDADLLRLLYMYDKSYGDYRVKRKLVPIMADDLAGMDVRVSASIGDNPPGAGQFEFTTQAYDDNGNPVGEKVTDVLNVLPETNSYTSDFLEVSSDFFDQYYTNGNEQASVYVANYAKLDTVMNRLKRKGYAPVSTFRLSVTDYSGEKVDQRLTIIGISAFGLVMLLLAEVLILRSLMKIRIKDFFVLKFIGMKMQVIRKISYFEMGSYMVISVVLTLILMWALRLAGIPLIKEMLWYYDAAAYLGYLAYNTVLILLTVIFFNRLLKGRLNA